jgi:hypothetical protein
MIPSAYAGATISVMWDWSDRRSSEQEAVLLSPTRLATVGGDETLYPHDLVDSRLRLRGTGRTAVVRFDTVEGKDFILVGHTVIGLIRSESEARK